MDRTFKGICVLAFAAMPAIGIAGWLPTEAGTYDYNDGANWDGGNKDGVFSATLTGDQTIKFSADTSLENGLTIAYGGTNTLTFVSDGTGAKTLTLGGDISVDASKNSPTAHVTIGSATADENLVLDLGGAKRTITAAATQNDPSKIGHLKLYATLANGSVEYAGKGVIKVYGANTYAGGTTFSNTGYIYLNNSDALGTGLATVTAQSETPRFHGDVSGIVITNDWLLAGSFSFYAQGTTWRGKLTIPAPIDFWCESEKLTIESPAFDDGNGNCAIANFVKWGSKSLRVDTPFEAETVTFNVMNGVWNQYGAITATDVVVNGDPDSTNTEHLHLYVANDITGKVTLGDGSVYVYLNHASALGGATEIEIASKAILCCDKYKASDLLAKITDDSTGVLALGQNETADFDMSRFAGLRLGANGGDRTITGVVTPNSDGVYRLGGGGKTLILGMANALSGSGCLEVRDNLVLTQANGFNGGVKIYAGQLELRGDSAALTGSDVEIHGGTFYINSNGKTGSKRVGTVLLRSGGVFQYAGNKSYATVDSLDKLILDVRDPSLGTVGGVCHLKLYANGKTATLTVGELERRNDMVFRIQGNANGNNLRVGGTNENTVVFKVGNADEITGALVGGGGAAGSKTVSVYPYAFIDNGTYNDSLTTYDANGFRGLDVNTEFVTTITPGTVSQDNVRLANGTTTEITADTTVNSVFMQGSDPNKISSYLQGEGKLKVTSGVVVLGYHRNAAPFVQCPVDFGNHQGVVCFARGKGSNWNNAIHGTAGAIFFQTADLATTDSKGTGLNVSGASVSDSTLAGDVVVLGYISVGNSGFVPGPEGRRGDMRVFGYANIAGQNIDGVFGTGYFYRNADTLTIGNHDADGDFDGAFISGTTYVKVGSGRQRVGGACTHTGSTTVNAGVLQFDGSVSASAVTVKSGATLAGSGSFAKLVTLEACAGLEVGSTNVEYQVMNLNGGLTLRGDATLTVRRRDRLALGEAVVTGALTIPADAKVTVNVEAGDLRQGRYTLLAADSPLSLANFVRGDNCRKLVLSEDGRELQMLAANGINLVLQ